MSYQKTKQKLLKLINPLVVDEKLKLEHLELNINRDDEGFYDENTLTLFDTVTSISVSLSESRTGEQLYVSVKSHINPSSYFFHTPLIGNIDSESTIKIWLKEIKKLLTYFVFYHSIETNTWSNEYYPNIKLTLDQIKELTSKLTNNNINVYVPEYWQDPDVEIDVFTKDIYDNSHWSAFEIWLKDDTEIIKQYQLFIELLNEYQIN